MVVRQEGDLVPRFGVTMVWVWKDGDGAELHWDCGVA